MDDIYEKIAEHRIRLRMLSRRMRVALVECTENTGKQHNQARILMAEHIESQVGEDELRNIVKDAITWFKAGKKVNQKKNIPTLEKYHADISVIVERRQLPPEVRPDRYQGGRLNLTKSDKDQHALARILISEFLESQMDEKELCEYAEKALAWIKKRKKGNRTSSIPAFVKYLKDLPLIARAPRLPPEYALEQ